MKIETSVHIYGANKIELSILHSSNVPWTLAIDVTISFPYENRDPETIVPCNNSRTALDLEKPRKGNLRIAIHFVNVPSIILQYELDIL